MKKIIKKFKKIWNNDCRDILVPIMSIIIFVVALLTMGIIRALIILILINAIYFIFSNIKKKDKKKNLSKSQKKKRRKKRLKILLLILLVLFVFGIIGVIGFCTYIAKNAPEFDEDNLYISNPTIVLDKNENEIAKLGSEKRVILSYDAIPEVLIDAILATEDSRFFEHNGVDWARFIKASILQVLGQDDAGGASTLTMQVSKNTHTSNESSGIEGIIRKFTDVYVSMFKIEKNYTKEQILTFYVNSQWLGKNAYGVEQVSLNYFGKSAKELNLAEAAMVAGLFQAPGRYDPYKNPEATEARRQTVLKLMLRHGYISKDEYNIAKKMTVEKIVIPKEESYYSSSELSEYQSFIDTVVEEVENKTGKNPYNTPMIIYTTLNTDFQDYINKIMSGETYTWQNDVAQAGVAVIDVKNGSVAAIGGGRNVTNIDQYNYATDLFNQIGSTAKPLYDYGPAVEYNNWSPYQILVDEPISYSDGNKIGNWDGKFQGFQSMRISLKESRNMPALKTFKQNNKSNVIDFVTKLGLTPEIYSCDEGYTRDKKVCINDNDPKDIVEAKKSNTLHEAHSIGGYNGESPLTVAAAYAAFANSGTYTEPYTFTKLIYQENGEEFINEINTTKAMSKETAYIISDMLVTTAPWSIGKYYNINGVKYAAKSGTTNFDAKQFQAHKLPGNAVNDLWAVGFNTEYAIGVWYGYDKISSEYYNTLGNHQHSRLFQAVGKKVFTNATAFTRPSNVVSVEVEIGCAEATLPSEFTPANLRQTEIFIKGTEPTNVSTRFSKLNDVANLKATVDENKITLTWDKVEMPEINTESYLRQIFDPLFENDDYLTAFINERLTYNNSNIGNIGYNVYLKNSKGDLELLDYVSTNKYETKLETAGDYTFVIKTAYSIFKSNMSDGKTIKAVVKVDSPIIPDKPTIDTEDDENLNDTEKEESTTN